LGEPSCVNLLEPYGDRYKVAYDPAYDPFNVPRDRLDPWMMVLPCRYGEIYPHGGGMLAVFTHARQHVPQRLAEIPGTRLYTDGDDGKTFLFPVGVFGQVAEVVRPRKRRRLSQEQRRRAVERLALYRFQDRFAPQSAAETVLGEPGTELGP
jgi:hypothetical protein